MFLAPRAALSRDWALVLEARKQHIHVPLVGIHMLGEMQVLVDFVRRVLALGWTRRAQFEDCWMSLFGVLCSTPIGDELASQEVQASVML